MVVVFPQITLYVSNAPFFRPKTVAVMRKTDWYRLKPLKATNRSSGDGRTDSDVISHRLFSSSQPEALLFLYDNSTVLMVDCYSTNSPASVSAKAGGEDPN